MIVFLDPGPMLEGSGQHGAQCHGLLQPSAATTAEVYAYVGKASVYTSEVYEMRA